MVKLLLGPTFKAVIIRRLTDFTDHAAADGEQFLTSHVIKLVILTDVRKFTKLSYIHRRISS